jgi:solute:Na+ symporter, SSS family
MPLALGAVDVALLTASLLIVVAVGLRASARTRSLDDYLLGDRDLPGWAILGSIVATETSTATVLSVPGVAFGPTGMRFLQIAFGYIAGRVLVRHLLLPLYFQGRLFSAYHVLGRRFGPGGTRMASTLFLVARNLGDGLRLFLTAVVLQQLAGWSFGAGVLVTGGVTILYTYFGGMRSVVWNDCLQFAIYTAGAIAAVFVIAGHIPGGWPALWQFGGLHDKFRIIDPRLSWDQPYTLWAGLVGGAVLTMGTHGVDQMLVQRYLSARSQTDAGRAVVLSGFVVLLQFALFLFIGVELACYYAGRPEVVFARSDQVFAHFIVHEFPRNTGLVGLLLAAILAAAMSTLASSLNSSASAVMNDFYLLGRRTPPDGPRTLALTRRLTLVFGLVQIGIGYWATHLASAVVDNALTIAGFVAGLLLGLFGLATLTETVGGRSAAWGVAIGFVVLVGLQFGAPTAGWPRVAYPWLAVVGSATTFTAGWLAERVRPRPART